MEFVLTVLYNQYFICASQETCFVPPGEGPEEFILIFYELSNVHPQ